jgi:hypothetical protein
MKDTIIIDGHYMACFVSEPAYVLIDGKQRKTLIIYLYYLFHNERDAVNHDYRVIAKNNGYKIDLAISMLYYDGIIIMRKVYRFAGNYTTKE